MATIESRIEKLEQAMYRQRWARFPPRLALLVADDYAQQSDLDAAIAVEQSKPGTVGICTLEFIEAKDGQPVTPDC